LLLFLLVPNSVLLRVRRFLSVRSALLRHERDLEARYPDRNAEVVMYCGGGFRSALTCDAAQKMGYTNVRSLIGGYKALAAAGWPMAK
jgi:rhodanese-related sulfurtransferase